MPIDLSFDEEYFSPLCGLDTITHKILADVESLPDKATIYIQNITGPKRPPDYQDIVSLLGALALFHNYRIKTNSLWVINRIRAAVGQHEIAGSIEEGFRFTSYDKK